MKRSAYSEASGRGPGPDIWIVKLGTGKVVATGVLSAYGKHFAIGQQCGCKLGSCLDEAASRSPGITCGIIKLRARAKVTGIKASGDENLAS